MIVQHNIAALNSHRNLGINNSQTSKNLEKLSSGYRINRAGDDAAGLAISEKMRGQIRGLGMAEQNAENGISLIQTAEGGLQEVHSILQRMRELAVQSSNGTYQDDVDRENLDLEFQSLKSEIDRIAEYTNYNGIKLLDGSLASSTAASKTATDYGIDVSAIDGVVDAQAGSATGGVTAATKDGAYELNMIKTTDAAGTVSYSAALTIGGRAVGTAQTLDANTTALDFTAGGGIKFDIDAAKIIEDLEANGSVKLTGTIDSTTVYSGTMAVGSVGDAGIVTATLDDEATAPVVNCVVGDLGLDGAGVTSTGLADGNYVVKMTSDNSGAVTYKLLSKAADGTETEITDAFSIDTATTGSVTITDVLGNTLTLTSAAIGDIETALGADADIELAISVSSGTATAGDITINAAGDGDLVDAVTASTVATDWTIGAATINDASNDFGATDTTLTVTIKNTTLGADTLSLSDGSTGVWNAAGDAMVFTSTSGTSTGTITIAADKATLDAALATANDEISFDIAYTTSTVNDPATAVTTYTVTEGAATPATDGNSLIFQIGANGTEDQRVSLNVVNMNSSNLGYYNLDTNTRTPIFDATGVNGKQQANTDSSADATLTSESNVAALNIQDRDVANLAVDVLDSAINMVSTQRAGLGALQNRLEYTLNNLGVTKENLTSAESTIRDVDMAEEMMDFTKNQILVQASQAMLAQANQLPQGVLNLLR